MNPQRIVTIGFIPPIGVLAVGLALIGLAASRRELDNYFSLPGWVYRLILISGSAVAVAALLSLGAVLICSIVLRIQGRTWCYARQVPRSKLKNVHDYLAKWFGTEIPPIHRMSEWHKRNNSIFQSIYQVRLEWGVTTRRFVGVFKVLPITAEAASLLEKEKVSGTTFLPEHIARKGEAPAAIYIGDVAGETYKAKAKILCELESLIKNESRAGIPIYTRPLTKHGARLVRQYKFTPINTEASCGAAGCIHKLTPTVS